MLISQLITEPTGSSAAPRPSNRSKNVGTLRIGWWCVVIMLLILAAYCLLVIYPSYASGLYLASNREIWANSWEVPLWSLQFKVVGLTALFTTVAAYYIATPLSLLVPVLAYRERRNLGWHGVICWLLVALLVSSVIWSTQTFATTLFRWYID